MDHQTIYLFVVLPSVITALLLALAWRPWNRSATLSRGHNILAAIALSLPWAIVAGYPTPFLQPWASTGDTARWFLDFSLFITLFAALSAGIIPATSPVPSRKTIAIQSARFLLCAAAISLMAWNQLRGILAYAAIQEGGGPKVVSIHITIVAVPLLGAAYMLIAEAATARPNGVLVPAVLSITALGAAIVLILCGSNVLLLMAGALAAIMIATSVIFLLSKPGIISTGALTAFFPILATLLIYARYNQTDFLTDYLWLLLLSPAAILVEFFPATARLSSLIRVPFAIFIAAIPVLIILWQLVPIWRANMGPQAM